MCLKKIYECCQHGEFIEPWCERQCGYLVEIGAFEVDDKSLVATRIIVQFGWCKRKECQADQEHAESQLVAWQAGDNAKKAAHLARQSESPQVNDRHKFVVAMHSKPSKHHGRLLPEQSATSRRQEESATADQSQKARPMALSCVELGQHLPALEQQFSPSQSPQMQETSTPSYFYNVKSIPQHPVPRPIPATHAEKEIKLRARRAPRAENSHRKQEAREENSKQTAHLANSQRELELLEEAEYRRRRERRNASNKKYRLKATLTGKLTAGGRKIKQK